MNRCACFYLAFIFHLFHAVPTTVLCGAQWLERLTFIPEDRGPNSLPAEAWTISFTRRCISSPSCINKTQCVFLLWEM